MQTRLRFLICIPLLWVSGCAPQPAAVYQGYVEGEYVYVASAGSGELQTLFVSRGDAVQAGEELFELDPEPERAALREAEQRVAQAEARLADLTKGLRPSEVAALEARLTGARANAEFTEIEAQRLSRLKQDNVISQEEMDRVQTQLDSAEATVARLRADLETARLGARSDEIRVAEAESAAAAAARDRARWFAEQKRVSAPAQGVIEDTLYRVGERVAPRQPVVVLLPPENIKVRFFVPESERSSMIVGTPVWVNYDGAADPVSAKVSFLSTEAEFTPPVIYSRENRAKLVYMVEAVFDAVSTQDLRPGQPVDVRLQR
jgi:HlyD family secretion protein